MCSYHLATERVKRKGSWRIAVDGTGGEEGNTGSRSRGEKNYSRRASSNVNKIRHCGLTIVRARACKREREIERENARLSRVDSVAGIVIARAIGFWDRL